MSRLRIVANLIQAANATITGIRTAPQVERYPTSITTADLPYAITWWGDGRAYVKGAGYRQEIRTARILLFYAPLGQDDAPTRTVGAIDILSALQNYYINGQNIAIGDPSATGGYQVTVHTSNDTDQVTDSGLVADLRFGGVNYAGFELRVPIRTLWSV